MKFFPFDKQTCSLFFGSWAHSNESISYSLYQNSTIDLRDFYDNQEWQMTVSPSHFPLSLSPWYYYGVPLARRT